MPRKKPEELEVKKPEADAEVVVPASSYTRVRMLPYLFINCMYFNKIPVLIILLIQNYEMATF